MFKKDKTEYTVQVPNAVTEVEVYAETALANTSEARAIPTAV